MRTGRRSLGAAAALVLTALALLPAAAQAGPQPIQVGAHLHSFKPNSVVTEPDGTAYVQAVGNRLWVFSPGGALVRRVTIPRNWFITDYGNGQLYLAAFFQPEFLTVNPLTGSITRSIGVLGTGFDPASLVPPLHIAVPPDGSGTIYVDEGDVHLPGPEGPGTGAEEVKVTIKFSPEGVYLGYVGETLGLNAPDPTVCALNSAGDVLGNYYDPKAGRSYVGVFSPQGATIGRFPQAPTDGPEYFGFAFSPDGSSIYAGVLEPHGTSASTSIARLSFSGHVLERFGTRPAGTIFKPDEYDQLAIAPNGDGWAVRTQDDLLYRFHVRG